MFEKLSPAAAWVVLIVAGLLETVWAVGMKYTEGFSKPLPTAIVIVVAWASFYLLGIAMRPLPAGTAYAVWTGIGAVGTVALGIVLFNEPATFARLACVAIDPAKGLLNALAHLLTGLVALVSGDPGIPPPSACPWPPRAA